jgi:hypothetical protein
MTADHELKARVLAAVAATPSPTRREWTRRCVALALASTAMALALFQAVGGLGHSAGRPLGITLTISGGWGLFCAGLSWTVLRRGRSMLGPRPSVVLAAALATPIVLIAWMHAFHGTYPEPFARVGWRCLAYNLMMATPPLGSLLVLRRGGEPRSPWALGAAVGAVSGAWAGVLVDLWCPLTNLRHLLVGHVLPLGLLIAAGALIGRNALGIPLTRSGQDRRPA